MPRQTPIEMIHGAAAIFAFVSRDIHTIAGYFDVKDRTIRRWAETPQWENALNVFGYEGERGFETQPLRDTQRDAGDTYEVAKSAYLEAVQNGIPPHQRASIVSQSAGITPRRARNWAKRFGWENEEMPE